MELFLAPKPKQVQFTDGFYEAPRRNGARSASVGKNVVRSVAARLFPGCKPALRLAIRRGAVQAPKNADQAYALSVTPKGIAVSACTNVGALYALQTLRQLRHGNRFQCCEILDYPDTEWRVCARPLLCGEGLRGALDWGDGRRAFVTRWKHEIDFALACRYNGIFCHGMTLDTDCWPGFADDMRAINRYARARGVRLIFSIYGISYGGWGGETYLGAAHAFVPGAGHEYEQTYLCGINNPAKPETGRNGTCRSNPALWKQKVADVRAFIQAIEPGALYIHHEDISDYHAEWELFWSLRCPECRRRWPNDAANAIDGGAGAIAHGYDAFVEARKGVRIGDYDAARDCTLWLTSPSYGSVSDDDATWAQVATLWANVAQTMRQAPNVYLCLREQFANDDGSLRIQALHEEFRRRQVAPKLMVFSVSGAALYGVNNAGFSSLPEMNSLFTGADGVFNFSGVLYQRPQQLFNCECTWNLECRQDGETWNPVGVSRDASIQHLLRTCGTDSRQDAIQRRQAGTEPACVVAPRHQQPDGWLAKACRLLYGEAAGELVWKYLLLRTDYNIYPLSTIFKQAMMDRVMEHTRGPFPETIQRRGLRCIYPLPDAIDYWQQLDRVTGEGLALIRQAAHASRPGFLRDELVQQTRTLAFGQLFARAMAQFFLHAQKPSAKARQAIADTLAQMEDAAQAFPRDFLTPDDGEASLYPRYCDKMRQMLAELG